MPKGSLNVSLKGADDIFSTEESRQEQQREQVQQIPIGELFPFKDHPFKVLDDESMQRTVESVEQYGVLSPLIARPRPEGGYEIISGHRRQHAAQLAGLDTLPVIVRNMDDDAAVLLMVDSNLQRENILPSERAFAYKMKLEALKNQGARSDLTSPQVAAKFRSDDVVAKDQGISGDTVRRYIRLTSLIPELLDMVDEKKIAFNPAVELSYLDTNQQRDFLEAIDKSRIQNFAGHLTPEEMSRVDDAVKISLALNPMGSIQKLKPIIRSTAAYAPPEVVDGKPPVYPYTPIKSDFEDAGTVEEMMLYTELQSAVHAMIQRLEYSFTFNPSLLTSPKRKKQVAEILTEAEKYIWRIKEEMRCA